MISNVNDHDLNEYFQAKLIAVKAFSVINININILVDHWYHVKDDSVDISLSNDGNLQIFVINHSRVQSKKIFAYE